MSARAALWLARAAAWSLLLGGWLTFGTLGLFWAPRAEWAFAPLALWLLGIGAVLGWSRKRVWTQGIGAVAVMFGATGSAGGVWAAMHGGGWLAVLAAAPCASVLLVAASRTVRSLRVGQVASGDRARCDTGGAASAGGSLPADRCASPAGPALAGALTVALLFADPADPRAAAAAASALWLVAAGLLAGLPWVAGAGTRGIGLRSASAGGCRPALFDCSLPGPGPWNAAGAARFAMLPAMASLSWTLAWCQGTKGAPQAMLALHLAAMFLPAFVVQTLPQRWRGGMPLAAMASAAMVAGALALWNADPLRALLGAALLQGLAWSLSWLALLSPARPQAPMLPKERMAASAAAPSGLPGALLNATPVLLLGAALGHFGLQALVAVHAALGLWAGIGLVKGRWMLPIVAAAQR